LVGEGEQGDWSLLLLDKCREFLPPPESKFDEVLAGWKNGFENNRLINVRLFGLDLFQFVIILWKQLIILYGKYSCS